jgi:hypothetical protein
MKQILQRLNVVPLMILLTANAAKHHLVQLTAPILHANQIHQLTSMLAIQRTLLVLNRVLQLLAFLNFVLNLAASQLLVIVYQLRNQILHIKNIISE